MPTKNMLTYLGAPIYGTVWKKGTTTLIFKEVNDTVYYKMRDGYWQRWSVSDQMVYNHLKTQGFYPETEGYEQHTDPIIDKIREMESRRKPIYAQV